MQRSLWIVIAVLLLAACGGSAPPPPPAPPKPKPPAQSPEDQAEVARAKADNESFLVAQKGISDAADAEAAKEARDGYSGQKHKAALDVALERRLREFEFEQMTAAVAALRATDTPFKAEAAAAEYSGDRYRDDLNRALEAHIKALIEKDPTLAGSRARKPEPSPAPPTAAQSDYATLQAALAKCDTESAAAATAENLKGSLTANEVMAAIDEWRWTNPEVIERHRISGRRKLHTVNLLPGDLAVAGGMNGSFIAKRDAMSPPATWPDHIRETGTGDLVAVNPAGDLVLVQTQKQLIAWHVDQWELAWRVDSPSTYTWCSKFSPDGKTIAVLTWSTSLLRLLKADTGELLHTLDTEALQVSTIQFSADSKRLFVAGAGIFRKYDVENGTRLSYHKYSGANLSGMVWSPDEKHVMGYAARGGANTIRVLDIETGKEVCSLSVGHPPTKMIYLGSGQLALIQIGSNLNLVDLRTRKTLVQHKIEHGEYLTAVDYSGRTFIVASPTSTELVRPEPIYHVDIVIYGRKP